MLRVAVVGGGIGGLTAAVALSRKGLEVQVFEQASGPARTGASIDIGPNAVRLLDALGLVEVRAAGVRPDAIEFLRWDDGSTLLRAPHGEAAERHFGASVLDFLRPELHAVLLRALPGGTVRFGARVEGLEVSEPDAGLVLADGTRIGADAIVAADGIRSPLRQALVGTDEPVFSGTVVYRGVAERADVEALHPEHVNRYWLGPNRHAVAYWISAGERLAVNAAIRDADWARESWTDEADPEEVLPAFAGWHEPLLERFRRCRVFLRGGRLARRGPGPPHSLRGDPPGAGRGDAVVVERSRRHLLPARRRSPARARRGLPHAARAAAVRPPAAAVGARRARRARRQVALARAWSQATRRAGRIAPAKRHLRGG